MGALRKSGTDLPSKIGTDLNPRYAVVFVPGLGGGYETWSNFSKLLSDSWKYNKSFDLFYFNFSGENLFTRLFWKIAPLKFLVRVIGGESIINLAKGLNSYLNANCDKHDGIVLVGHSMGGLISKQCIINQFERSNKTSIAKLVTFATPHLGSIWASFGVTTQIKQMNFYKGDFLTEMHKNWNDFSIFKHVNPTYFIATKDIIVSQSSAAHDDNNEPDVVWVVGKGHSSIISPLNPTEVSMAYFIKILRDFDVDPVSDGGVEEVNFEEDVEDEE